MNGHPGIVPNSRVSIYPCRLLFREDDEGKEKEEEEEEEEEKEKKRRRRRRIGSPRASTKGSSVFVARAAAAAAAAAVDGGDGGDGGGGGGGAGDGVGSGTLLRCYFERAKKREETRSRRRLRPFQNGRLLAN
ncbi:hypothetical protein V1477_008372 [Vespula maculifrons]|uniref:Uncharacterized protein n=1 Tax=Vespula maculifrons TaxID=7453 RepID=A0ABD2CCT8_VESMC